MIPQWVMLAVLAGIASNFFGFVSRYALKDDGDSNAWAFLFEFIRLIVFLIFIFFDFSLKFEFQTFNLLFWVGFTEFISVYLYMQMHKYSHLSISTIISSNCFFIFWRAFKINRIPGNSNSFCRFVYCNSTS